MAEFLSGKNKTNDTQPGIDFDPRLCYARFIFKSNPATG